MADISVFGLKISIKASKTLPVPYIMTDFADDADPVDCPSIQIADKAMGANGRMITWSKANPCLLTLNMIPGQADDIVLGQIFQANKPSRGKTPARDIITITKMWPDGKIETWSGGSMTDGMPGNSGSSAGRMKTKAYMFAFESYSAQP